MFKNNNKDKELRKALRELGVIDCYRGDIENEITGGHNIEKLYDIVFKLLDHLDLEYVPENTNESKLRERDK